MLRITGALLALGLVGAPLFAQTQPPQSPKADSTPQGGAGGRCARPDTITVFGNHRVDEATIRGTIGIVPHAALNYRDIGRAIKALYSRPTTSTACKSCAYSHRAEGPPSTSKFGSVPSWVAPQ